MLSFKQAASNDATFTEVLWNCYTKQFSDNSIDSK